jgi:histidinol phosphatase-like enzyme
LLVFSNGEEGIKKLKKYADWGFTEVVWTNSSSYREKLLNIIAEKIASEFNNVNR